MELPNIAAYAYQDVHVWSALLTCLRPLLYQLHPCPSYSRCRDRNNCVRNFNYVRNVVRSHKTWVCRAAYFPKGMKLSELEDLKYFANSDSDSSSDSDSDCGMDTDDDGPISESSSSDDSGDSNDEPAEVVWAVGNGPCL